MSSENKIIVSGGTTATSTCSAVQTTNLKDRLRTAYMAASEELKNSRDVQSAVTISGEENSSIVISSSDNSSYLTVCRGSEETPFISIPVDVFRYVYLENLKECRVFVKCKLLKIMFNRCTNTQISVREPIISSLEVFECTNISVFLRVVGQPSASRVVLERSDTINVYQTPEEMAYIVKECTDITANTVNVETKKRTAQYDLGKADWSTTEMVVYSLSESGLKSVVENYTIGMGVMFANPEEDVNDIFGTTPPIKSFLLR